MSKKTYGIMSLLLLLPFVIFGAIANVKSSSEPSDTYPTIYISPEGTAGINVGEVFTVTVGITGLVDKNLYGFDIMFKWNTATLQYLTHEVKVPVETYPEGILHQPILEIKNEANESDGTLWIAYASLLPAEPFNGDGIFFTITFVVLEASDSKFTFDHIYLASDDAKIIPTSGSQNPESSTMALISCGLTEHQKIRCEKWLEWWISVTWNYTARRCSSSSR
jgi:hypothetical protein